MTESEATSWEHFSHDADMGIRGYGASCSEAFANAALAMTAVITNPETVASVHTIEVNCQAHSLELLFNAWINALIYEMATRRMLFRSFNVRVEDNKLWATCSGEPLSISRHKPSVEIKGATLTELSVSQLANGRWLAQCVVDV